MRPMRSCFICVGVKKTVQREADKNKDVLAIKQRLSDGFLKPEDPQAAHAWETPLAAHQGSLSRQQKLKFENLALFSVSLAPARCRLVAGPEPLAHGSKLRSSDKRRQGCPRSQAPAMNRVEMHPRLRVLPGTVLVVRVVVLRPLRTGFCRAAAKPVRAGRMRCGAVLIFRRVARRGPAGRSAISFNNPSYEPCRESRNLQCPQVQAYSARWQPPQRYAS